MLVASLLLNNWNIVITISGVLGGICFGIAAVSTGIFISANQQRANFYMMKKKDRKFKKMFKAIIIWYIYNKGDGSTKTLKVSYN